MKRSLSIVLFVCFCNYCFAQKLTASGKIDSLVNELKKVQNPTQKADILNDLSNFSIEVSYDQAEEYNKQALALSRKLNYQKGLQYGLYFQSLIYFYQGKNDQAKVSATEALTIAKKNKDFKEVAGIHNRLGYIEQSTGNYEKALENYLNAKHLFDSIGYEKGVAATANKVGIFYESRGELSKALEYYKTALSLYEKLDEKHQQATVLNNIGVVYYESKDFEQAMMYYRLSLQMVEELGDKTRIPIRQINIGKVYKEQGKYATANQYFVKVLEAGRKLNKKKLTIFVLNQLGENEMLQGNYIQSIRFLKEGVELATNANYQQELMDLYRNLSDAYSAIEDFKHSKYFTEKYWMLKDSIQNMEKKSQLAEIKAKYEASEKEKAITELQSKNEKKDIILYAVSVGSFLLLILIVVIVINYRKRARISKVISDQNEELARQRISELLKEQQLQYVEAKLEGQTVERRRIAKDLHDGVGGTLASIKLSLVKSQPAEVTDIIDNLDKVCEEVRAVSHNLMPPVLSDSIFTDVVKDFVKKSFQNQDVEVSLEFFPEKELNELDKGLHIEVLRIIQELVTNISKHAHASVVDITLTLHDDFVNLIVGDNGKGFVVSKEGKGIGLKNISYRVSKLNGRLNIDSNQDQGTTINIDIPSFSHNLSEGELVNNR